MKLFQTHCPCCKTIIPFASRRKLIYSGIVSCPHCQSTLTASALSATLGTVVLGVPVWLLLDNYITLLTLPNAITWLIGLFICVAIGRLTFPLANLVAVDTENDTAI